MHLEKEGELSTQSGNWKWVCSEGKLCRQEGFPLESSMFLPEVFKKVAKNEDL